MPEMKKYLEENSVQRLTKEHLDRYIAEKGREKSILAIMEENAEFEKAVTKVRRKELVGDFITTELKANMAEEAAHVYMAMQSILYQYGITPKMVNEEIEKSLRRYYNGHEEP